MIRVSVEVGERGEAFGVTVQAESIGHALEIAAAVFPSSELRVHFPLDPDTFFVRDGYAAGLVEPLALREEAG